MVARRQAAACAMAEDAVAMGRRPSSTLAHPDAPHAGPMGADHDGATASLWVEAKRIWLAGSCQRGR
jgi:hypothetical protein